MAFLFDNKATVAYAAIITVWSALFLSAWDVAQYQYQVIIVKELFFSVLSDDCSISVRMGYVRSDGGSRWKSEH